MLLTIKQPVHQGYRSFHDYTPPTPPSTSRFSPVVASSGPSLPPLPPTNKSLPPLPAAKASAPSMSTPHRGLPPPAAMTLPQPQQQQPPPPPLAQQSLNQQLGQLPAPPQQWQGAEESMRNWLLAKAEEDKRKQEEEKTRQETLRLEQRKIEQDMLRTSLSGGIPPYMIPMVFAGMGGGNLPNASLEWAQHYMAQAHQLQHQQQIHHQQQLLPAQGQTSPEQHQRRDSRAIQHYAPQAPAPMTLPSTPIGPPQQQNAPYQPSYQMSPAPRSRQGVPSQAAVARLPQTSHLPRLNTGEMHSQPPTAGPNMQIVPGQPSHPLQQTQSAQQETQQSSPSIYFHHWQPPTTQASNTSGSNQPTTPSDHTSSPKKRKATGPHQSAPPPTSQPQYTSPQFSHTGSSVSNTPSSNRRRGHSRQRSDISSRGLDSYGRPASRHRHTESGFSTHSQSTTTSPPQSQVSASEPRRSSGGGSHPLSSILQSNDSHQQQQQQQQPPPPSSSSSSSQSRQQPQPQQSSRDPQYAAGPEMKHEAARPTPDEENSRHEGAAIKRDEGGRD